MISYQQDQALLRWAGEKIGATYDPSMSAWISRLNDDGSPRVVVVFDRVDENNCQVHIASDGSRRWFSNEFTRACFAYAFNQLKVNRITAVIKTDNEKSLKACLQFGFTKEGILRGWFGDQDGIVLGLLKNECKWI